MFAGYAESLARLLKKECGSWDRGVIAECFGSRWLLTLACNALRFHRALKSSGLIIDLNQLVSSDS